MKINIDSYEVQSMLFGDRIGVVKKNKNKGHFKLCLGR